MALVVDMAAFPAQQQPAAAASTTTAHPITPKENVPPLPTTPKAKSTPYSAQQQRVEFAPAASFYSPHRPTTIQPQLSGGSGHGSGKPVKGILKPFKVDTSPAVQAREAEKASEKDLPPTEPIADPEYVAGPLRVLVRSLSQPPAVSSASPQDALALLRQPTVHDLTETYALLLARLKHARLLLPPALEPLRENRAVFLEVLERDIALAGKPTRGAFLTSSDSDRSSSPLRGDATAAGRMKKTGVSAEEIRDARDAVTLAHAAIKLLAVVFLQQSIHSLFSEKDLSSLLSTLLALPTNPCLPTPNPRRTNHYAMWALSNARISPQAVLPHRDRIRRALERGVKGELTSRGGSSGSTGEVVRGQTFEAMAQLLMHYPGLLVSFTPLISHVLSAVLIQGSGAAAQSRLKAASALAAYSLALKRLREQLGPTSDLSQREPLEKAVLVWLKCRRPPSTSAPNAVTSTTDEKNADVLEKVLKSWLERAPEQTYVLPTLSALLHIAGPSLLHAVCLKPLMQLLQTTLKHRSLLGQWRKTWSVLVWSLGEGMSRGVYPSSSNAAVRKEDSERLEKAEKMIRQGISALVRAGDCSGAGELWTLMVRAGVLKGDRRWIEAESIVREAGVRAVVRVLRAEGEIPDEDEDDEEESVWEAALEEGMWDGRACNGKLETEPDCFVGLGKDVSKEEVAQSWEALVSLWWIGVKAKQDEAADEFLKLLCVASPSNAAELVFDLLTTSGDRLGVCAPRWAVLVKDYIAIILSSFPASLDDMGDRLAELIVSRKFDDAVMEIVCQLVSRPTTLLSLQSLELLSPVAFQEGSKWSGLKPELIGRWCSKLHDGEATGSEQVLRTILSTIDGTSDLVRALAGRIGDAVLNVVPRTAQNLTVLAGCPCFDASPAAILHVMMETLHDLYGRDQALKDAMDVLNAVRMALLNLGKDLQQNLLTIVPKIEGYVGIWLRDEQGLVPENEYNDAVAAIYTTVLSLLRPLTTATQETLDALAPFLACAFYRMPEPGLCPIAFRDWWMVTFHGQEGLEWPACLRPALRWWARSDGAFAMGLGLEPTQTQSHFEESLVPETQAIPDSEPDRVKARQQRRDNMILDSPNISTSLSELDTTILAGQARTPSEVDDSAYQADISDPDAPSQTLLHVATVTPTPYPRLDSDLSTNEHCPSDLADATSADPIEPFTCSVLHPPTAGVSEVGDEIEDFSRSKIAADGASDASEPSEIISQEVGRQGNEPSSDSISTGVVLVAFGQDAADLANADSHMPIASDDFEPPTMLTQEVLQEAVVNLDNVPLEIRTACLPTSNEELEQRLQTIDEDDKLKSRVGSARASSVAAGLLGGSIATPAAGSNVTSVGGDEDLTEDSSTPSSPPMARRRQQQGMSPSSPLTAPTQKTLPSLLDRSPAESSPSRSTGSLIQASADEISEDEADEASIEWSLSQEAEAKDDDEKTKPPVISTLGKRKRSKSITDTPVQKRPRSPSVELGDIEFVKPAETSTAVLPRASPWRPFADPPSDAISPQQIEDTFIREQPVLSPLSTPIRSGAQAAAGGVPAPASTSSSARKRAGVFLECVEVESKRRKLSPNSISPPVARPSLRPNTSTSTGVTSTPLKRFVGPQSKAPAALPDSEDESRLAADGSLKRRGKKTSETTMLSRGKAILRRSATDPSSTRRVTRRMSSLRDPEDPPEREYNLNTSEDRATLLLELLKVYKTDVKHVSAEMAENVQSELIEALHATNTNKKGKAGSADTERRRK